MHFQWRDAAPAPLRAILPDARPALHPFDRRTGAHLKPFRSPRAVTRARFNASTTRSRNSKEHGFGIDPPPISNQRSRFAYPNLVGIPIQPSALGHNGYPASALISRKGPKRPIGSPDHGCDGETVFPSPQSDSQASVERYTSLNGLGPKAQSRNARRNRGSRPCDARQLDGERGCQNIVMQPLRRGRKPRSKAMSRSICRSEQDHRAPSHSQNPWRVWIRYKCGMIRLTDEQWGRIRSHFPEEHTPDWRPGRKPGP